MVEMRSEDESCKERERVYSWHQDWSSDNGRVALTSHLVLDAPAPQRMAESTEHVLAHMESFSGSRYAALRMVNGDTVAHSGSSIVVMHCALCIDVLAHNKDPQSQGFLSACALLPET